MWLVFNTNTLTIHGRFYLEKDAKKKARRMVRHNPLMDEKDLEVEWLDGIDEKQWRMWKKLQS